MKLIMDNLFVVFVVYPTLLENLIILSIISSVNTNINEYLRFICLSKIPP